MFIYQKEIQQEMLQKFGLQRVGNVTQGKELRKALAGDISVLINKLFWRMDICENYLKNISIQNFI